MLARISLYFFGAALITLPMVGVGVLALGTGRDWGFGLQPSWVFLFLGLAIGLIDSQRKSDLGGWNRENGFLLKMVTMILLAVALSGFGILVAPSGEPAVSAWSRFGRQIVQLMIMLGFVVWPAVWTRGADRWRFTVQMILIGTLIQAGYGLMQYLNYYWPGPLIPFLEKIFTSNPAILSGSEELYLGNAFQNVPRLRGTMCEPLYLGNYLLFIMPWVVWGRRLWPLGRLVPAMLGLLLLFTWSRGAWLGLAFQLVVLVGLFLLRRQGGVYFGPRPLMSRRLVWAAALTVSALAIATLFSDWLVFQYPRDRLVQTFSNQDWSNLTRFYSMQAGWRAFLLSPVVGVGWGQFAFHFPLLVDPLGLQSQFTWPVVNNFPLEILCQSGILGFLVFMSIFVALFRRSLISIKKDHPPRASLVVTALVAVAGVWFQLLTFSQYNLPHIWLSVGLLLAALQDHNYPDLVSSTREDNP